MRISYGSQKTSSGPLGSCLTSLEMCGVRPVEGFRRLSISAVPTIPLAPDTKMRARFAAPATAMLGSPPAWVR